MDREPGPFVFTSRPARPHLQGSVETLWYAQGTVSYDTERILPNARTVVLFNLGDPFEVHCAAGTVPPQRLTTAWLCGPQTRYLTSRPLSLTHVIGATLHPLDAAALFGCPASLFTSRAIPLDDLWAGAADTMHQ